jgi:hypothetical protein
MRRLILMRILSPVCVFSLSINCFLQVILDQAGANAAEAVLFQADEETDSNLSSLSGSHRRPSGSYGPHHFASMVQDDWFE